MDAVGLDVPGVEPLHVRREPLEQRVLDDHREPERREQRGESAVQREVEQADLKREARCRHRRHDEKQGQPGAQPCVVGQEQRAVSTEDREIAVREVDEPHHAEDQRKTRGEQRVEPTDEDALDDGVDPGHAGAVPK